MILEEFRHKVARIYLRKRFAMVQRQRMMYDLSSAKYIGILCAPQDEACIVLLKEFLNTLSRKGIKYSVLGYFNKNKIPENFLYLTGMDFIIQKDLNLLLIPQNTSVDKFIQEPFDMLIDCSIPDYFPIEYIARLSLAKYKVGIFREGEPYYDLTVDITKNRTIEYFFKSLDMYLSNLTSKNSKNKKH